MKIVAVNFGRDGKKFIARVTVLDQGERTAYEAVGASPEIATYQAVTCATNVLRDKLYSTVEIKQVATF